MLLTAVPPSRPGVGRKWPGQYAGRASRREAASRTQPPATRTPANQSSHGSTVAPVNGSGTPAAGGPRRVGSLNSGDDRLASGTAADVDHRSSTGRHHGGRPGRPSRPARTSSSRTRPRPSSCRCPPRWVSSTSISQVPSRASAGIVARSARTCVWRPSKSPDHSCSSPPWSVLVTVSRSHELAPRRPRRTKCRRPSLRLRLDAAAFSVIHASTPASHEFDVVGRSRSRRLSVPVSWSARLQAGEVEQWRRRPVTKPWPSPGTSTSSRSECGVRGAPADRRGHRAAARGVPPPHVAPAVSPRLPPVVPALGTP